MSRGQSRRHFFQRAGTAGAAWMATRAVLSESEAQESSSGASFGDNDPPENLAAKGEIPRRKFGKTGEVISAIGLGGHTFAQAKTEEESIRIVQEAVDAG